MSAYLFLASKDAVTRADLREAVRMPGGAWAVESYPKVFAGKHWALFLSDALYNQVEGA